MVRDNATYHFPREKFPYINIRNIGEQLEILTMNRGRLSPCFKGEPLLLAFYSSSTSILFRFSLQREPWLFLRFLVFIPTME